MKNLLIIALIFLLSGCPALPGSERHNKEMEAIRELLRDPKTRSFKDTDNNPDVLYKCPILFEVGEWERYGEKIYKNVWNKDSEWFDGKIVSSGGTSLDFGSLDYSHCVAKQKNLYSVYIGPWKAVTLTHKSGFFPFYKTESETKLIRFFAYQDKEGGPITYQYESQTSENKKIPEKSFSLSPTSKYAPDNFSLCVVKWTAKYGYNAIAEVKSKNPFSKNYLVPTGKIIKAEE